MWAASYFINLSLVIGNGSVIINVCVLLRVILDHY